MMTKLKCAKRWLDLSEPQVMGILNVTPDSFSDGGRYYQDETLSLDRAVRQAEQMFRAGAAIVDVGGESTRPGAARVSLQEEMDRVLPVIEKIVREVPVIVSVDTSQAQVMHEAVTLGAGMINDVRALQQDDAEAAASASNLPVCLMHMQGEPSSMQNAPQYQDICRDVLAFLSARVRACENAGIDRSQLLIDPGFGFGKTLQDNLQLFSRLNELKQLGLPLLVGVSRKSMIGALTGKSVEGRLAGSVVLAALAVMRGADIIRAHDVEETVDAIKVAAAIKRETEA